MMQREGGATKEAKEIETPKQEAPQRGELVQSN